MKLFRDIGSIFGMRERAHSSPIHPLSRDILQAINSGALHSHPSYLGSGKYTDVIAIQHDGQSLALKLPSSRLGPEKRARQEAALEHEWDVLSGLHHPCVVGCHGFLQTEAGRGLLFELMAGGMDSINRVANHLSPDRIVALLSDVASGLDATHEAGIIHRDVKPGNILLRDPSGATGAVIADYELSCRPASCRPDRSSPGTIIYAAPEQIEGSISLLAPQTDQHALGVVAYQYLGGGYYPFTEWTYLLAHIHPRQKLVETAAISPDTLAVLSKATDFDASNRYATCSVFVQELGKTLRR